MPLILFPAIAYILLTLIFVQRMAAKDLAEALVKAHIVLFTFVALSTELLSSIHRISFPALRTVWLSFLLLCFVAMFRYGRRPDFSVPLLHRLTAPTLILGGAIAFILATTFAGAMLYPPNTSDSMTYHMARVAHWISNNEISFYPTAITRQNYQMPLAEFAILHLQVLSGSDFYANLVQWTSFVILICLAPLIARELGLSRKQQLISGIVIASLPMAILQASSAQNDLVVSSFIMSFALFMLRLRKNLSTDNLLFSAVSLGLGLLTKGTAILYCATIGISLAFTTLAAHQWHFQAVAALSLVIVIALLINAGHFARNYRLYGHPLSTEIEEYRNEEYSAATLASNILRNGALHLGTFSERINAYQYRALQGLLGWQLNNPKTTWRNTFFGFNYSRHEDTAGNLMHMLIILFTLILLPVAWAHGRYRQTIGYAVGILLGAVVYCWILKWQPWASRLHTPLFALAAPLVAIAITSDLAIFKISLGHILIVCMICYSLPFALTNSNRSLVSLDWSRKGRMPLYFNERSYLFSDYNSAMRMLQEADATDVGLYLGGDDWEYPFWVFAGRRGKNAKTMTFRHVGVGNASKSIAKDGLLPPYVIATIPLDTWKNAPEYTPVYASHYVTVLRKLEDDNPTQPK